MFSKKQPTDEVVLELERELRSTKRQLENRDEQIVDLNRNSSRAERDHNHYIEDLNYNHGRILGKLNLAIKETEADRAKSNELIGRELRLEVAENKVKVEQQIFDTARKEISEAQAALDKQLKESEAVGFKKGYADGISDGLRKATEITSEDRATLAKVAIMAAASHSTAEAQETLANHITTTKALSDGHGQSKKSSR